MATTTIALVTGGSRGLGKDMAVSLAKKGIDVLLTYNSNEAAAKETIQLIEAEGRKAAAIQLDMGNLNALDSFVQRVATALNDTWQTKKFDYLVNNAGVGASIPFENVTEEDFDRLLNIHYKGVYFLTQQCLPYMNDGGGIVNISSGTARFAYPGYSVYSSLKGAIEVLTRNMAKELGKRGIKVNVVAPGPIKTDFNNGAIRNNADLEKTLSGLSPLGRVGVAEDIGPVVAFLCTDDARWINGQRIEVSGGINL